MKNFLICASLLMSMTLFNCGSNGNDKIEVISSEEMKSLLKMEEVQFVDVRTPDEFQEGHIEGAQNIDFYSETFDEDIKKLDKSKPVILYCRSGGRSAKCAEKMIEAGFVKVYDLDGGISKWTSQGNDVIQ